VLVAQLLAIDQSQLDEYIGSLSSQRMRAILDRIRLVIEP
jgi:mRNA-degrading endonuclease toxin of MazEF toxin-antitoxin module